VQAVNTGSAINVWAARMGVLAGSLPDAQFGRTQKIQCRLSMLLGLVLALRLESHPSESESMLRLSESSITSFLSTRNHSVILYNFSLAGADFMNFGIARFRDRISFAFTDLSTNMPPSCTSLPCIVAYSRTDPIPLPQPNASSSLFAAWCESVLDPSAIRLSVPEQVRAALNRRDSLLFCVDCDRRPESVDASVPVYLVRHSALAAFGLPSDPGAVYLWRPRDRQFLPFHGNFAAESRSPILSMADHFETKEFFCGYFITADEEAAINDIGILIKLAGEFGDKLSVVTASRQDGKPIALPGRFHRHPLPFFFMFRSGQISPNRWFIPSERSHDYATVRAFVQRVIEGKQPYTFLNATLKFEPPTIRLRQVNALNAERLLLNKNKVTLLMILSSGCPICKKWFAMGDYAAGLIDPAIVSFYWMNGQENDMPAVIPDYEGWPQLFLWPAGDNYTTAVQFDDERTMDNLLAFIRDLGGSPEFKVPVYDPLELVRRTFAQSNRPVGQR
jgi:hypothetical protein